MKRLVATEDNFLFSYNIINISAQIKKALNRERSNVGRSAYSDSVKHILTSYKSDKVLLPLVKDMEKIMLGTNKDETNWTDVSVAAVKSLNKEGSVVFVTPGEMFNMSNEQKEILLNSGKRVIQIPDNVFGKTG